MFYLHAKVTFILKCFSAISVPLKSGKCSADWSVSMLIIVTNGDLHSFDEEIRPNPLELSSN